MTTLHSQLERILSLQTMFFVDIGSSCYTSESQSETLLEHGWSGIMFECDESKFRHQQMKLVEKKVTIVSQKVTPDNILQLLEENNVPEDFYLSLDIDGYDYYVLDKILSKYKPQFIISEINEKIPAGIKFAVKYNEEYFWDGSHYYGYSISMLQDLLDIYGYKIDSLDWNNVILVPGKQEESILDIYENGYLNREGRKERFSYNLDFDPVYSMERKRQIDFINNIFSPLVNERQANPGHQIDGRRIEKRNFILE